MRAWTHLACEFATPCIVPPPPNFKRRPRVIIPPMRNTYLRCNCISKCGTSSKNPGHILVGCAKAVKEQREKKRRECFRYMQLCSVFLEINFHFDFVGFRIVYPSSIHSHPTSTLRISTSRHKPASKQEKGVVERMKTISHSNE